MIVEITLYNIMNIIIRKLKISEAADLRKIAIQTFVATYGHLNTATNMKNYLADNFSEAQITLELNHPNSQFFFAEIDKEIVGYMKLNTGDAQTVVMQNDAIEIERIYVLEKYQGQKIGHLLYKKAVEFSINKMATELWLGVWEKNKKAIQFYKKNGFVTFDTHIFKLGEDAQTDLMMKFEL